MPRKARELSPTDFYHIMMRGINKERIFEKKQNKEFLVYLLKNDQEDFDIEICAFCIMDNHAHLIVKGNLNDISEFIKKINIKFAMSYNKSLERVGHVFQDRYRSENIYNDNHLMQAISYVHNNPIKAGLVKNISDYKWSSYLEYFSKRDSIVSQNMKSLVLDVVGSKKSLQESHKDSQFILFIDTEDDIEKTKQDIFDKIIKDFCEENCIIDASQLRIDPEKMENLIKKLLEQKAFSHREIAGLLEVNRNLVHSLNNKE